MSEIIAALILACTNLARVDVNYATEKSACVQRVALCAEKTTHEFDGDLGRAARVLRECAKEVHL